MPVHVHGLLAQVLEACSHVLFAGRRHGDVTNITIAVIEVMIKL